MQGKETLKQPTKKKISACELFMSRPCPKSGLRAQLRKFNQCFYHV